MVRHLAIVPARGNSKGIPGKNVKSLQGRPLLAWTAEAALRSGLFDRIVLSTDSPAIAEVGRSVGLEVPFLRPAELAQDASPMLPVIENVLAHLEKGGYTPDVIFLLQPTSPFRRPETLRHASRLLVEQGYDSVVGVTRVPDGFSPYYLMRINADGFLEFFFPEAVRVGRRQDAAAAYHRCGSVFAFTHACLREYGDIYGKRCYPLVAEGPEGVNIDTMDDWALATTYARDWR